MGLFVTIGRWTPDQAEAMDRRFDTLLNGTAPKAVMDAWAKMKIIAQVISPQNGCSVMVVDVTDQTWLDGTLICRYMEDVVSLESFPVCSLEEYLKVKEKLPRDKIPKK
ncbi:MAG: hypothetical protein FJ020_05090 [Chloroflexi bacterium]|nr:hypothetical protein [Chloroflexota bacterium]